MGNLTRRVQAPGVANFSTSTAYDRLGRATTNTDARSKTIQMVYDGRENLLQVTDPRGLSTRYSRTGLGETTGLVSPDTGAASHTLDAAGNVKTRTDSRGVTATYDHDVLNRVTGIFFSQGDQRQSFSWNYDQTGPGFSNGIGRLTSTQFPGGSSRHAYDPQGRLTSTVLTVSTEYTVELHVGYGYDAAGRLTGITYPSGRVLSIPHVGGQPAGLSLAPGAGATALPLLSDLQFEPGPAGAGGPGPLRSWVWELDGGSMTHERVFDVYGRMVRYPLGGALRDLSYDAAGRIESYVHWVASSGAAVPALNQTFGYDELGRLTGISTGAGNWSIGYDDNGNRTAVSYSGPGGAVTRNYATSASSNRLEGLDSLALSLSYDAAGNLTAAVQGNQSNAARMDLSGRLASVAIGDPNRVVAAYLHDASGLRVLKRVHCSTGACPPGANDSAVVDILYVHDQGGQLLGEYLRDGTVLREYVWLHDMPVAVIDGTPASPQVYYLQTDHLGAPRVAVDRAGRQRWTWVAEPFGHSAPVENPLGIGVFRLILRMPGQYFDAESGLAYNWHRSYDAGLGRYVQSDPIGLAGGINTYSYVENNPVSFSDPSGLVTWKGWAKSISLGPYQREEYVLTSECLCGAKWKIKVTVNYGGPGKGPGIAQKWYATLTDPMACPSPSALAGPANSFSAGAAVKWGLSYSRTRVGLAESVGWDVIQGLGAAVGVAAGISSVEVLERTPCDDCPK